MNTNQRIEVEVHTALRDYIRQQGNRGWPHHLTMARLVARAFKLGRPALLQTQSSYLKYCWSYLMPCLLGDWSVIIVAPETTLQRLVQQEIPRLSQWLGVTKKFSLGNQWQEDDRILLTTPHAWLSDRLGTQKNFPSEITVIIDAASNLEDWTRQELTITIESKDWQKLKQINPQNQQEIIKVQLQLTKAILTRPSNRYECFLFDPQELNLIKQLCQQLQTTGSLTPKFHYLFLALSHQPKRTRETTNQHYLIWVERDRNSQTLCICLAPGQVASNLQTVWQQQTVVLVGSYLDREPKAEVFRQKLGLPEMLVVKFAPNQQQDLIRLFIPDRFPLANTPEYSSALNEKINTLVGFSQNNSKFVVILVEDVPLRGQVASNLAAKYGTVVKVDTTEVNSPGVLVCSWQFWQQQQDILPTPQLLIMTTLPLPSLEHPLVASRVEYYKYQRQDWFRLYLLPTALKMVQQAIIPLRESQGMVALLDSRVNFRSYGKTILSALEPCARINYIDPSWFLN